MPLTLLQMIQRTQAELGLPQCTTVVGNPDSTTTQMFALANRTLDELRRMNRWTAQQFEYNLVVEVPLNTTGDIVAGALNTIINIPDTTGLEANYWQVTGNAIPVAARILSVDSSTQVTMTMEATAASVGQPVAFGKDTYPMPNGFDWFNNQTMWDRTNRWALLGPDSPQLDQWHRSGIVATGPRRHFRQLSPFANQFRIWPAPFEITDPLQLVFEYLSINAVLANGDLSAGVYTEYFENDDDMSTLDDQAIILGIKFNFWQAKGFNYVPMQNYFVDYVERLMARDGAAPTLRLTKRLNPLLINSYQVQDGFYPGPGGGSSTS